MPIRVTRSVIPSLFTSMNLFSGFFAMVKSTEGEFMAAAWLIVLAGVFDALDGAMARLTKSSSEFGVELDSLADVVSFGAAPAFMLYMAFFHKWETTGVLLAALPAICGAIRLARFNVQLTGFDKDYFMGLPIPSAAVTLISYLVFFHLPADSYFPPGAIKDEAMAVLTVGISLLMVSTIRYDTIPKPSKRTFQKHPIKTTAFMLGLVVAAVTKGEAIFPLMALYLLYGIIRHIIILIRTRNDDEDDTLEGSEPTPFDI
ncbi:MAG: CDP-diacylglycerol--serine O-phosphatidyltransferase [Chlorobi bacterium CHB2]|nr:CDP-diacylglycerol--serine O-phosphatidyltransferase [Chlorobi bacterium CHB2]